MKIQTTILNGSNKIVFGNYDEDESESLFVWFYEFEDSLITFEKFWSDELFQKYSKLCKRLKLKLLHEN